MPTGFLSTEPCWIEPIDLLSRLEEMFGGLANPSIMSRLRNGRLRAIAESTRTYVDYGYKRVVAKSLAKSVDHELWLNNIVDQDHGEIGPAMWKSSVEWDSDWNRTNWYEGRFVVTTSIEPLPLRIFMNGVKFLDEGSETASKFRKYANSSVATPGPSSVRGPYKWDWERALVQLVAKAHHDSLDDILGQTGRGRKAALTTWIAGQMPDGGPDPKEVGKRSNAILNALDNYRTLK